MTSPTSALLDEVARIFERIDILLARYDARVHGEPIELDEQEGPLVLLEPRETFDACVVGIDPSSQRLIYSERLVLLALMHQNDWDDEAAVEWFNTNVEPLAHLEGGPIFCVSGYLIPTSPESSATPSEACPET
jgi:hypothetical protein